MIKAIVTYRKGYKFRSRLEARWSIFFDKVGLHWEYEKEGFDIDGKAYLPDFWIKEWGAWVEIKAQDSSTIREDVYTGLSYRNPVILIEGNPWPGEYTVILYSKGKKSKLGQFKGKKFKNLNGAYNAARSASFEHNE